MQEADDFIMLRECTKACYLEASLWAVVKDVHKEQKRLHRTLRSQVNLAKTKLIDIYLCCYKVCLPKLLTYICEILDSKRVK